MPNAAAHKLGAGLAVCAATALLDDPENSSLEKPILAGSFAYHLGTLPDIIEPATSPHHRQFFHSCTCFGLIGFGMYRTYKWETENEWQSLARFALLVAGGAYVTHLLMDSRTPRGLPVI